ncbi:hypothetical protein FXO38_04331 [Capsicum annuum]|nr:hypothetical protein FXO38_04331 [Capsicum annuum]
MAVSDELRQRQKVYALAAVAEAPRWIPERGQVVKNAIRKIFSSQAYFLDCLYLFWNMEHIIGWEGSEMVSVSRCAAQMILLAGPGVVISTFFLGASLKVPLYTSSVRLGSGWCVLSPSLAHSKSRVLYAFTFVHLRGRTCIYNKASTTQRHQTGRGLQRRSSSLLSHSMDHVSRSFSRELGLMSWPESTYKAMQCRHDGEQVDQQETNMSTRAMQLNIFGSMSIISRSSIRSGTDACFCEVRGIYQQKGQVQGDNEDIRVQLPSAPTEESHTVEDSSDDSGGEDEHLIRIDSGRPSFPQWITEEDKAS